MATSITVDGIVTQRPGVYTRTDASQMEATSNSARGIVALIGTGEGGIPVSADLRPEDFLSIADPVQARQVFRSGDLREGTVIAFSPANDEAIPGGAQRVVAMKVNQATQSSYTFNKGDVPVLTVTSTDYGAFTEQISVLQEAGTEAGTKQLTVSFEEITETADNLGGSAYLDFRYREDGTGWDNVRLQVAPAGVMAYASRREAGLEGDAYDLATAGTTVTVVSSSTSDTRRITIYGTNTSDEPQTETLTMNGQNIVRGVRTWNRVYGASMSATLSGATVTMREASTRTVATTVAEILSNVLTVTVSSGHRATVGALATVADVSAGYTVTSETAISAVTATSISMALTGANGTAADGAGTVSFYPDILTVVNNTDGVRKGVQLGSAMFVARGTLKLRTSSATLGTVALFGFNASGQAASEIVQLPDDTSPVETATSWSQITAIALEDIATAAYVHIAGIAVATTHTTQTTIQKVADHFNARQVASGVADEPYGFYVTVLATNPDFLASNLDLTQTAVPADPAPSDPTQVLPSGEDCKTATLEILADLYALMSFYDNGSEMTSAERLDFQPKVVRITITAQNSHTYTVSLDGFEISVESDVSGTQAEIQTLLVNAIMRDHRVFGRVSAAAYSTTAVDVTSLGPTGFDLTTADANLVLSVEQELSGAGAVPDNTSGPVFLQGGSEGTAVDADWQQAFDLLKLIRVNTIVPLTGDPAVHAMLKEHLIGRANIRGRSEADGVVGLSALDEASAATGELPGKASIKEQIRSLNSRHVGAVAQSITRFNSAASRERTVFEPWFTAAAIAGMQAGAPVGTPLTEKGINALAFDQDSSWHPDRDFEELAAAGLLMLGQEDGEPIKVIRNLSTYIRSTNLLFQERSMNDAHNTLCYEIRRRAKSVIGKVRGRRQVSSVSSEIIKYLGSVTGEGGLIDGYDAGTLRVRRVNDSIEVSVTIFYPPPVNFMPITINAAIQND